MYYTTYIYFLTSPLYFMLNLIIRKIKIFQNCNLSLYLFLNNTWCCYVIYNMMHIAYFPQKLSIFVYLHFICFIWEFMGLKFALLTATLDGVLKMDCRVKLQSPHYF